MDLSGLEKWSDEDKNAAIEMIKRNANVFSRMTWIWVGPIW